MFFNEDLKSKVTMREKDVFTEMEWFFTATKGEEWLSMGLTEQPESWEIYFTKRQKERAKKGIIHKHLLNEKYKSVLPVRL